MWLPSRGTWPWYWTLSCNEECSPEFDSDQQPDFMRLDSECVSQSTTGPWNLMLQHTERLAAIGSFLMFFLLLICSNNFRLFIQCFSKKILSSRPRRKRICVGLLALSIFIINIKVALIATLFLFCASSGKMVIQKKKTKKNSSSIILKYLHNHNLYLSKSIIQIMH